MLNVLHIFEARTESLAFVAESVYALTLQSKTSAHFFDRTLDVRIIYLPSTRVHTYHSLSCSLFDTSGSAAPCIYISTLSTVLSKFAKKNRKVLDLVMFAPTPPDILLMNCEDLVLVFGNRSLDRRNWKSVWKRGKASKADGHQLGSIQTT